MRTEDATRSQEISQEAQADLEEAQRYQRELEEQLAEIRPRHLIIRQGPNTGKVIQLGYKEGYRTFCLLSKTDAAKRYDNKKIWKKGGQFTHPFDYYYNSPYRREVDEVIFEPGEPTREHKFNIYSGFPIRPKQGDCSKLKKFMLDIFAGGNEEIFEWQWSYLSLLAQNPRDHRRIALVFQGAMGAGKGIWYSYIRKVFGPHFHYESTLHRILGNFNAPALIGNLLMVVDECDWRERKNVSLVKALITESRMWVEQKYHDPIEISNYAHFIFLSNDTGDVPAFRGDRRFAIFDVSDIYVENYAVFDELVKERDNEGPQAALYEWLNNDISKYDPRKIPRTRARIEQILANEGSIAQWWIEVLMEGNLPQLISYYYNWQDWPTEKVEVARDHLYTVYLNYWKDFGRGFYGKGELEAATRRNFGKKMKELIPPILYKDGQFGDLQKAKSGVRNIPHVDTTNVRLFPLLPLGVHKQYAASYLGMSFEEVFGEG